MKKFKTFLEYAEAIVTIIGFLIAIWGSLAIASSELAHKVKTLVEYHHKNIEINDLRK